MRSEAHARRKPLHVAFWKKPLDLMTMDGHHGPSTDSTNSSTTSSATHSVQGSNTNSSDDEDSRADDSTESTHEMERTLGLFDLIMIGIGGTVGSGVFATAGLIASVYAGPAATLSWLIAGVGCLLSGLSFMELSCLIPSTGSTYAYTYHALGELPAMFAGFLLTLEYGISSAGGARSWSDKLTTWMETELDIVGPEWMKPKNEGLSVDLYAGLLMTVCVVVVLCGMQAGKVFVNVVTMTKISVVLFIIVVGVMKFDSGNITPLVPEQSVDATGQLVFGWPGVFLGASASFYGYIGYDEVCCLAGEAKNPTKNIPRAVIGTILGAATLSTLATFSLVGMQMYTEIDAGESYGKAFEHVGWSWAASIVSTGEVLTMPITSFIGFLAQPRVFYAMAKDGLLPGVFARVDKNGNLFQGTLICGIAIIIISVFVPFKILWSFISLGILVAFNLTNSSLLLVRAARAKERSGNADPAHGKIHSYAIGAFLVTSFLAAYHCQKSIIAVIPIDDETTATFFDQYMNSTGPYMAGFFSVVAFALMLLLKFLESDASSASPISTSPGRSSNDVSAKKHIAQENNEIDLSRNGRNQPQAHSSEDDDKHGGHHLEKGEFNDRQKLTHSVKSDGAKHQEIPAMRNNNDDDNSPSMTFEAPFVPFTPCIAIFFNWFLFAQMDLTSVMLIVLWLLFAFVIYCSYSIHHSLAHQQVYYHRVDAE